MIGRVRSVRAIAANHGALVLADGQLLVFLVVMPVVLTLFLKPAFALILRANGFPHANGAEQAIPGAAALFGFNAGIFLAISIYRDHGWGVWDRIRSSEADRFAMVVGTSAPYLVVAAGALLIDFALGDLLFGLKAGSAAPSVLLLCGAYSVCVIGMGLLLAALTSTLQQVAALGQPVATLLAIAGGAFMPLSVLPGWARWMAPGSPSYWMMRGCRSTMLEHGGLSTVLLPCAVLLAFGVVATVVAVQRLDPGDLKTGWA